MIVRGLTSAARPSDGGIQFGCTETGGPEDLNHEPFTENEDYQRLGGPGFVAPVRSLSDGLSVVYTKPVSTMGAVIVCVPSLINNTARISHPEERNREEFCW